MVGLLWVAIPSKVLGSPRLELSFDEGWCFHLGEVSNGQTMKLDDSSWRKLTLPHDWSAEADFSQQYASCTAYLPGGIGWYRKTFPTEASWRGKKIAITFDGIYRNAEVWINGHRLGARPFGYITYQYDLTPHLVPNGSNVLAVRVERENHADSRWYTGSGIYRHVWLSETHSVHIPLWGNCITTPRATAESADVVVHTEVTNTTLREIAVRVSWQIARPDGTLLAEFSQSDLVLAGGEKTLSQWQKVPGPQLWSPDSPSLYQLISRVFVANELVDETRTPFGIRTFDFDANHGFSLNGKNLKIKGLCMHHDAGVVGAAVPEDVLARRIKLIKSIGGNAIRCSHNPMAPELYRLCDELGLLVMDEAFDEWEIGKRKWVQGRNAGTAARFGYSEDFEAWAERDCADWVRRDRNHPSIVMWSIGNEIDYPTDPYVLEETRAVEGFAQDGQQPKQTRLAAVAPRLIAAVKRNDPTRPVTMALSNVVASNATGLAQMLDVVGYNYQEDDYARDHREFPTRVIYGSENALGFRQWQAVAENPSVAAQFLWVGFDFLGEANEWPNHGSKAGLFDTRGFLKSGAYQRQALWSEQPMVHLAVTPKRQGNDRRWAPSFSHWNWKPSENLTVKVASNCDKVVLALNGHPLEEREVGKDGMVSFDVTHEVGRLVATGFRQGKAVAVDALVTAGAPAALELELDRSTMPADGCSVSHAIVSVVDANGMPVVLAKDEVTVKVNGAGHFLGLDNGDMDDATRLASNTKALRQGRALVLLQSGTIPGKLSVEVTAAGLKSAIREITINP